MSVEQQRLHARCDLTHPTISGTCGKESMSTYTDTQRAVQSTRNSNQFETVVSKSNVMFVVDTVYQRTHLRSRGLGAKRQPEFI